MGNADRGSAGNGLVTQPVEAAPHQPLQGVPGGTQHVSGGNIHRAEGASLSTTPLAEPWWKDWRQPSSRGLRRLGTPGSLGTASRAAPTLGPGEALKKRRLFGSHVLVQG